MKKDKNLYKQLVDWKTNNSGSSLLDISVSDEMSYNTVMQFTKKKYKSSLVIDCEYDPKGLKYAFKTYKDNVDDLFLFLAESYHVKLRDGKSVVVFEDTAECPCAADILDIFAAAGRYDYIDLKTKEALN